MHQLALSLKDEVSLGFKEDFAVSTHQHLAHPKLDIHLDCRKHEGHISAEGFCLQFIIFDLITFSIRLEGDVSYDAFEWQIELRLHPALCRSCYRDPQSNMFVFPCCQHSNGLRHRENFMVSFLRHDLLGTNSLKVVDSSRIRQDKNVSLLLIC